MENVILSHKLHKIVVNPTIPTMFKTDNVRLLNIVSEEYESWIVQDQALFTWLISIISELVIPIVLFCKHAYELWDKVHKHFHSQMKAKVHQLIVELKTIKKGNSTVSEYVLRIRAIVNSLLAIGDPIVERYHVDAILQGLPEEYNSFMMMMYGKVYHVDIYEVKTLLYMQEAQMENYKKNLPHQVPLLTLHMMTLPTTQGGIQVVTSTTKVYHVCLITSEAWVVVE